jgi:hypothetical protein
MMSKFEKFIFTAFIVVVIFIVLFLFSSDVTQGMILTSTFLLVVLSILYFVVSKINHNAIPYFQRLFEMVSIILILIPVFEASVFQINDSTKVIIAGLSLNSFTIQIIVVILSIYLVKFLSKEEKQQSNNVMSPQNSFEIGLFFVFALCIGSIIFFINSIYNITSASLPWLLAYLVILLIFYLVYINFEKILGLYFKVDKTGLEVGLKVKDIILEDQKIYDLYNKFSPLEYTPETRKVESKRILHIKKVKK